MNKVWPDATFLKSNGITVEETQNLVTGENQTIPIIYGTDVRVGLKISAYKELEVHAYLLGVISLGRIQGVKKLIVDGVELDINPEYMEVHEGTIIQEPSPFMIEAYGAEYTDDLVHHIGADVIGTAYIVIKFDKTFRWKNIEVIIDGMVVHDPRGNTYAATRNPSLNLADFIKNPIYGQGKLVADPGTELCADYNDELIYTDIKRSEMSLYIDSPASTSSWVETMRAYAECFVIEEDGAIYLYPNKIQTPRAITLTASNMKNFRLHTKGNVTSPNVVTINWTNTSVQPWRTDRVSAQTAGLASGDDYWRESTIPMTGYQNYTQAARMARVRLNWLSLAAFYVTFTAFDEALQYYVSDVLTIEYEPIGLTPVLVRIVDKKLISPGRWDITAEYYSDEFYDYSALAEGDYSDVQVNLADGTAHNHATDAQGGYNGERENPSLQDTSEYYHLTQRQHDGTMVWAGSWVQQEYKKNEVVLDDTWTMIAVRDTNDKAGPTVIGDAFQAYEGTGMAANSINAKTLLYGMRVNTTRSGYIYNYSAYTYVDQDYVVYFVADPSGEQIITTLVDFKATTTGWNTFTINPVILAENTDFDIVVITDAPADVPVVQPYDYNYLTPNNPANAAIGNIVHSGKELGNLYISYIDDNNTAGCEAFLKSLTVGDKISGAGGNWTITTTQQDDLNNQMVFGVTPALQGTDGQGIHAFTFETVVASDIDYQVDVGYWDNPVVATRGLFIADGDYNNAAVDGNAYGINLQAQEATVSPDWEIVAVSSDAVGLGIEDQVITTYVTKTVGSGKDFETINDAVDWLVGKTTASGGYVRIDLDAGTHELAKLTDRSGYYAWYWSYIALTNISVEFRGPTSTAADCIITVATGETDGFDILSGGGHCFIRFSQLTIDPALGGSANAGGLYMADGGNALSLRNMVLKNSYVSAYSSASVRAYSGSIVSDNVTWEVDAARCTIEDSQTFQNVSAGTTVLTATHGGSIIFDNGVSFSGITAVDESNIVINALQPDKSLIADGSGLMFKGYGDIVRDYATTSGAITIDPMDGNVVTIILNGDTSFTLLNTTLASQTIQLALTNAGDYATTFTNQIKWTGGALPTFTSGEQDLLIFTRIHNTWFGSVSDDMRVPV